jgi:hypothetical protein
MATFIYLKSEQRYYRPGECVDLDDVYVIDTKDMNQLELSHLNNDGDDSFMWDMVDEGRATPILKVVCD